MSNTVIYAIGVSLVALIYGGVLISWILKQPAGEGKMKGIALAIQEGAKAYVSRQYKMIAVFGLIAAGLLAWIIDLQTALGFIIGAVCSGVAGYIGITIAVRANVRTTEAAGSSMQNAFDIAIRGGAVTGLLVVGLGLLSTAGFYGSTGNPKALIGLVLGGSLISLFARLGGGIFTKAADVGADMVGKSEAGIPEDDPRNPAVIADNVGDNVGDCAGMAADLFETYTVTIVACILLGHLLFPQNQTIIVFPLALAAVSVVASIIGSLFIKVGGKQKRVSRTLFKGLFITTLLSIGGFWLASKHLLPLPGQEALNLFYCTLIGLGLMVFLMLIAEYYTGTKHRPVREIAKASNSGHGTNIIAGLALSMESTALPIISIVLAMLTAFQFAGLYGMAIAAVAMLSMTGIIVTMDAFGPISDNASGIAEMAEMPDEIRDITTSLDRAGNTTKALAKTYAIGAGGLAALVVFGSYIRTVELTGRELVLHLLNPNIIAGMFIGGLTVYVFAAIAMKAAGRAAGSVVEEVRRQFREIEGIMEGTAKPEYGKAVDLVTKEAIGNMLKPSLLAVLVPIIIGVALGPESLGGFLLGAIMAGIFLGFSMTTGGSAWDSAKKYIEDGNFGGKGSFAHQAAVTGDTVGDPYKDTAGPAIGPLMKIINLLALLMIPFLL